MNQQIEIEVIDKDGWKKVFPIQKNIFHIGSIAANEIVLETKHGAGVSPRHAQLIALQEGGYRLVNLGDSEILLGENGDEVIAPRSVAAVTDGSVLKIGDFTLAFHGEATISPTVPGAKLDGNIGLRLLFAETQIAPNQSRGGTLIVSNQGDQTGVQFDLELEGLDDDCFTLEPAPMLSSGSEAEVAFRFFHRGYKPLAGKRTVTICATAPKAYPNDVATAICTLDVQPYFLHTLEPVVVAAPEPKSLQSDPEIAAIAPIPAATPNNVSPPFPETGTVDVERQPSPSWESVEPANSAPLEAEVPEKSLRVEEMPAPEPEETQATSEPTFVEESPTTDVPTTTEPVSDRPPTPEVIVLAAGKETITPVEATEPVTDSTNDPTSIADSEWWPETDTESDNGNEEVEVIVLKAVPPPEVEVPAEPEPVTDAEDWWSESDTTKE